MGGVQKIGIVGLGYVGLPTALAFYKAGFSITGIDISARVVELLNRGESPLIDETEELDIPTEDERWKISTDFCNIADCNIILITVPTPITESSGPDLSFVESASRSVLQSLGPGSGAIVVLESTVYPGVTREILGGLCEEIGLVPGKDVHLAFCPERINPGTENKVGNIARVIGCDDPDIGILLANEYGKTTSAGSHYVGRIEIAEAAKMVENLQRDIDIALANELAIVLPRIGVDVEEVLSAAATKWNFHRHTPGIGVGGHCIPVDPYYYIALAEKVGHETKISKAAREINEGMPHYSAEMILRFVGQDVINPKVMILGYSYKPELGDVRETPVEDMVRELRDRGARPIVWDPLVDAGHFPEWVEVTLDPYQEEDVDIVVLATSHSQIIDLNWEKIRSNCKRALIFDGRRTLDRKEFESMGWKFSGIGIPSGEKM
jgi:nucleotide sugar dehydrogenase